MPERTVLLASIPVDVVVKNDATKIVLVLDEGVVLLRTDKELIPVNPGVVVAPAKIELALVNTLEGDVDVVIWPLSTVVNGVVPAAAVVDEVVV